MEDELLLRLIHLRSQAAVVILYTKVVLNEVKGLLVDFLVLMALEKLNFIQAYGGRRKQVCTFPFLEHKFQNKSSRDVSSLTWNSRPGMVAGCVTLAGAGEGAVGTNQLGFAYWLAC